MSNKMSNTQVRAPILLVPQYQSKLFYSENIGPETERKCWIKNKCVYIQTDRDTGTDTDSDTDTDAIKQLRLNIN